MKRNFFVWLISFAGTGILLIGLIYGYFTAKNGIAGYIDVKNNKTDVPYNGESPENFSIKLNMPMGEEILLYFDFVKGEIDVSANTGLSGEDTEPEKSKYNIDISYALFGDIVDRVGGINYTENGNDIRLTGVTAAEKIQSVGENKDLMLKAFLNSFSKKTLTKSDFLYIIENAENSDLALIDLFPLKDDIIKIMGNVKVLT